MRIATILLVGFFFSMQMANAQKNIPEAIVQDINGNDINILNYSKDGKPKIISLWATWCGPCRQELNALKKVYPKWKDNYDVEIVAITVDRGRMVARAKSMFEGNGWDYTFMHDKNQELMGKLGITGIPYSILIDKNGEIKSVQTGYFPGYEKELENKLKAL